MATLPTISQPTRSSSFAGLLVAGSLALLAARSGRSNAPTPSNPGARLWWTMQRKPAFTPPNRVFGRAWPLLWMLSSLSLGRVWRLPKRRDRQRAIAAYCLHGGLNAAWSPLFFGRHRTGAAAAAVLGDLAASTLYLRSAWRLDRVAGALAAPMVAWLGFAAVLNVSVWRRGRS